MSAPAKDRRRYPRTAIDLPVLFFENRPGPRFVGRGSTINVCPDGLLLQSDAAFGFRVDMSLEMRLLIPQGAGHWPYPGQVHCTGRVLRVAPGRRGQVTVAAKFDSDLRLHFPSVA